MKLKFNFDETKYIYILAGIIFLTGLLLLAWFGYQTLSGKSSKSAKNNFMEDIEKLKKPEEDCKYKRKLDGVCVELEKDIDPKIIAVMVENNLEAWPLSGIAEANVIYEAPVEGNIPRFMAIYILDSDVEKVGPVRSARPYYLNWASEYGNPMYLYVGGSPDALDLIESYGLFGMNEFSRGWYFWRSEDRAAPHNVYISSKLWNKASEKYSEYYNQEDYDGWVFEKINNCADNCVSKIEVPISSNLAYKAVWQFNTTTQKYARFQNTKQDFDMNGDEVSADTIIVQKVKTKVLDDIGRKEIATLGSGEVFIFRNGKVFTGEWFKESRKDRTKFYDETGEIIPLQAGKIWVEILSEEKELKYSL